MHAAWKALYGGRRLKHTPVLRVSYLGDSIVDQPLPTWPDYMADFDPRLAPSDCIVNHGVNGARASQLVYATSAYLNRPTGNTLAQEAWFLLHAGGNDIGDGVSAATTYGYLTDLWALARADGFRVVAMTVLPRTSWGSGSAEIATALNGLILGDSTRYDFAVSADQVLDDPTNTDWYYDGTHPTELGAQLIAEAVVAVMRSDT